MTIVAPGVDASVNIDAAAALATVDTETIASAAAAATTVTTATVASMKFATDAPTTITMKEDMTIWTATTDMAAGTGIEIKTVKATEIGTETETVIETGIMTEIVTEIVTRIGIAVRKRIVATPPSPNSLH